jgi:hypothetical protein
MKTKTSFHQFIGFLVEVTCFILTGFALANKDYLWMYGFLFLALASAFYTGELIKQQALEEEYK